MADPETTDFSAYSLLIDKEVDQDVSNNPDEPTPIRGTKEGQSYRILAINYNRRGNIKMVAAGLPEVEVKEGKIEPMDFKGALKCHSDKEVTTFAWLLFKQP